MYFETGLFLLRLNLQHTADLTLIIIIIIIIQHPSRATFSYVSVQYKFKYSK